MHAPYLIRSESRETPRKRRRIEQEVDGLNVSEEIWLGFLHDVDHFEVQHIQAKGKFAFDFVEGPLVKALRSGDWYVVNLQCFFVFLIWDQGSP